MAGNEIGKLVKKAKGDDRSLREYARDSGVDVAVISKIINGTYVPKKTDVYKSLTSPEASPRGGVTYKQLIEADTGNMAGMKQTLRNTWERHQRTVWSSCQRHDSDFSIETIVNAAFHPLLGAVRISKALKAT